MPFLRTTISKKMDKTLREYSDEMGVPIARIVREALTEWAQKRGLELYDDIAWGGPRKTEEEKPGQPVAVSAR